MSLHPITITRTFQTTRTITIEVEAPDVPSAIAKAKSDLERNAICPFDVNWSTDCDFQGVTFVNNEAAV